MSIPTQETVPTAGTSVVTNSKELNAEAVTTMTVIFLKRMGHKCGLKLERVSLEGEVYTVEVETKKFTLLFALARQRMK